MAEQKKRRGAGFIKQAAQARRDAENHAAPQEEDAPPANGMRMDGWGSALSGIGSALHDKRMSHTFRARHLSYQDAIEMWRGDDIAFRAIESVPSECFREGYDVVFPDGHDKLRRDVNEQLQDLGVNDIVEDAMKMERAFGGAAILVGAHDGRALDEPLDPARVTGIDWLTLLEPIELHPEEYYEDPGDPKYGQPRLFAVDGRANLASDGVVTRRAVDAAVRYIHESRLIIFPGIRVSRYQAHRGLSGTLWGDSMLTRIADVLRDFQVAWSAAGIIVTDFAQPVFTIENLMQLVAKNGNALANRMRALEMGRSVARAVLLDNKEKFERIVTSVTGLPELLDRISHRLAAAIDMPLTLLMGQSPKGLGNEGESDVRFYYDRVASLQTRRVEPIIRRIVDMLIGTMRKRGAPKKYSLKWHPLWQMTEVETAQARLSQARADSMYVKMAAVYPDEIRKSRFGDGYSFETQVDETKEAPGFIAAPPHGLGPTPGAPGSPGPSMPAPPAGPGSAVPVTPHVRAAPKAPAGGEPAAPEGGDKPPANRDERESEDEQEG